MTDRRKFLGTIELPSFFDPIESWEEARTVLLECEPTDDVKALLAQVNSTIAEKKRTPEHG